MLGAIELLGIEPGVPGKDRIGCDETGHLKDFTRLIEGLDPEAAQQLLDPAIHLMMDAVHRFEGTVNQVLGDGIMALFGAPIAHEDHALRACYAALAVQSAIRTSAEAVRRMTRRGKAARVTTRFLRRNACRPAP